MSQPVFPTAQPTGGGWSDVDLATARAGLERLVVIDVREVDEWNGELGHLAQARLVPLATVAAQAVEWDRAAPVLVVCKSGGRSGRACGVLRQMGFAEVYNLTGGMLAWNAAGLPVTRG